jgi:hypothetical protein
MEDINDSGQVVGYGNNGTLTESFISTTSGSTVIAQPGWSNIYAAAINDSGQAVGGGFNGTFYQGFIGTASGITPIPGASEGLGINDIGQVAGYVSTGVSDAALIGTVSGITLIPLTSGIGDIRGSGINGSGQVAATVLNSTVQAFVVTTSGSTLIPMLSGWSGLSATAINDSGQVAGNGYMYVPSPPLGNALTPLRLSLGAHRAWRLSLCPQGLQSPRLPAIPSTTPE